MITGKVLLVDDDLDALDSLERSLRRLSPDIDFISANSVEQTDALVQQFRPEVCVLDLVLSRSQGVESGFEALKSVKVYSPNTRVIVLTGHGRREFGIRCLALGAASFLQKPVNLSHLAALIADGIVQSQLKSSYQELLSQSTTGLEEVLIGQSDFVLALRDQVIYAGMNSQPVLVNGETGTGKGVCARAIHRFGKRKNRSFVKYQPTLASNDLLNSELFGHARGAFTGAVQSRRGLIQEADGGTLFLDEIDEFPQATQVLLLGVLQDKHYRVVGESDERSSDFRLVCACNKRLENLLESGKLRSDLYHRIAHERIVLKPLRDRREDIEPLAEYFLNQIALHNDLPVWELDQSARSKLVEYSWPGNVRECQAAVEGAAFRANRSGRAFVSAQDLHLSIGQSPSGERSDKGESLLLGKSGSCINYHREVEEFKVRLILDALRKNRGNQSRAAAALGLERSTMRRILERNDLI